MNQYLPLDLLAESVGAYNEDNFEQLLSVTFDDTPSISSVQNESISLRTLVSMRDAGLIIGRGGKNISSIREKSNAKIKISDVAKNVPCERIITISGPIDICAKACRLICASLMQESVVKMATINVLVPNVYMGTIIGKKGNRIKELQQLSGARITSSEDLLPNSSERKVVIYGVPDSVYIAVYHLAWILSMNPAKPTKTICYQPELYHRKPEESEDQTTESIYVSNEMIGCVIGKAGSKINEIRQKSGCKIKISAPEGFSSQRCITLVGSQSSTQIALLLLCHEIESEKQRCIQGR